MSVSTTVTVVTTKTTLLLLMCVLLMDEEGRRRTPPPSVITSRRLRLRRGRLLRGGSLAHRLLLRLRSIERGVDRSRVLGLGDLDVLRLHGLHALTHLAPVEGVIDDIRTHAGALALLHVVQQHVGAAHVV